MQPAKNKILLVIALLLSTAINTYAQNAIKKAEIALSASYAKILDHEDSAYRYADKFRQEFTILLKNNPATISYNFKLLQDSSHCYVTTSADGAFRVYSWDRWTGGSMHYFDAIYQYRTGETVSTQAAVPIKGNPGTFCSKIYTASINGKAYYLAILNGIYSSRDAAQSVQVFTITNGKLDDTTRIFKTKSKILNRIDVPFDFFSVVDRPERPLELITYNETSKEVYIPLVDKNGQVTHSNLIYRLTGDFFEYVGVAKSK
ncbi:hypothetical protein [Chitinophaga sp. Cy-1792]|uniref:hypothetical protein n=1 Tax=Chitinophaga sp. Cy-1792 TaxID=2608339 RepID=UPI001420B460|nr:hypothetical protein [Chitinophaga sp. Cy-1792]NIG54775.1 hypothetical protein [Chitinophaga sp. Cy-1792]